MIDIALRIGIVFILVEGLLSNSHAGPKEDYELQERCGKWAEELFKREYGVSNTKNGQAITGYRNHYSKVLHPAHDHRHPVQGQAEISFDSNGLV